MTVENFQKLVDVIKNSNLPGKVKLGGGLYLWVGKKGDKTFKLRTFIDGNDKWWLLGKFPEMGPELAWKKAIEWQSKLDKVRQANDEAEFNATLNQISDQVALVSRQEQYQTFSSKVEFGEFIRKLFEIANDNGLKTEIRLAVWLQMLLPSRPSELLVAKRSHFNLESLMWVTSKIGKLKPSGDQYEKHKVSVLSQCSIMAVNELFSLPKPDNNEGAVAANDYLFPRLANMKKHIRDEVIASELSKVWPTYFIEPEAFWNVFKNEADKYSFYRHEFVTEMLIRSDGNGKIYNDPYYFKQRHELANWWGDFLVGLSRPARATAQSSGAVTTLLAPPTSETVFQKALPKGSGYAGPDRW